MVTPLTLLTAVRCWSGHMGGDAQPHDRHPVPYTYSTDQHPPGTGAPPLPDPAGSIPGKYHENFILAVNTLHRICDTFPSYEHDLIEKFMCETGSEDCWLNRCEKCSNAKIHSQKYSLKESHAVVWYEWRKDKDGCLNKVEREGLTDDLFQHICFMLPRFLKHCYVKRNQTESYNEERNMVGSHDFGPAFGLIQENYTCTYQDEIQSAHWQQKQVRLFTAAIWFEGKIHPTVFGIRQPDSCQKKLLVHI